VDAGSRVGAADRMRRPAGPPELITPVLRWHLSCFAKAEDDALIFTGPAGAVLRRSNFRRRVWLPALDKAELPAVHFHDLRHTGNNLTAAAGANLRELMARMGHSSTRAALIYLHSTDERQKEIADALGDLAAEQLKRRPGRARETDHRHATGTAAEKRLVI
jgi:integrase